MLLLAVASCVDTGPGPTGKKVDPTYIQSHLLSTVPTDIERLDIALDGITYLGNKVDKTRVPPGQPVTVTHYWKVDADNWATAGSRWRIFSQLRGAPNTADFMNLTPTDMQRGHGPTTWHAGEIIEDVQVINIRPDWRSHEATLLVGLIEVGKHGTLDRMEARGARVVDRAIVATKLEIDLARAPAPKGSVYIQQANGAITVDGLTTDPGWLGIPMTELVPAEGATGEPVGKATAKMTWDDQFLYVFVTVVDSDITSPYKQHDDPLWKADCVELFIDADGNRQGYVELQVNPNNATFDSWFATTRAKPGDEKWDSGMVTAIKLRGSTEAGDSGDIGWDAEIAIPWAAVKGRNEDMKVRLPPEVGDRWRLNVVRVDRKTGDDKGVWASSWNRITMADFHALDRMLVAVFADRSGSIVPQAKAADEDADADADAGSGSGSGGGSGSGTGTGSGSGTGSGPGPGPGSGTGSGPGPGPGSGTGTGTGFGSGSGSGSNAAGSASPGGQGRSTLVAPTGAGSARPIAPGAGSARPIAPTGSGGARPIAPTGSGSARSIAPSAGSGSALTPAPRPNAPGQAPVRTGSGSATNP